MIGGGSKGQVLVHKTMERLIYVLAKLRGEATNRCHEDRRRIAPDGAAPTDAH